jgi:hypothetical protein
VGSTPTRRTSFKASRVCGGMADSLDSVSRGFTALWVRLPPDAPTQISSNGSRRLLAMQGTGVRLSQSAPRPSRCSRVNAPVEERHTRLAQTKEFAGSNPARRTTLRYPNRQRTSAQTRGVEGSNPSRSTSIAQSANKGAIPSWVTNDLEPDDDG